MRILISISCLILLLSGCRSDSSTLSPLVAQRFATFEPKSVLPFSGIDIADVWGYVDETTGREYALVGHFRDAASRSRISGMSIVDVSNPKQPVVVSTVDNVPGFDIKVWQHYAYTVIGNSGGLGAIVDLSNPREPKVVGKFPNAHNIFISDDGHLFTEASIPPLAIYDLNTSPTQPRRVWGGGKSGHDATVVGNTLYDFHGRDGMNIYDVSEKGSPLLLSAIQDPSIAYFHSGWPSKDGSYLFLCDELSLSPSPDITVWNISDLSNPRRVAKYGDGRATVHNLYVVEDIAFVSYYNAGIRIFDVSNPEKLSLLAEYDTSSGDREGLGGIIGAFGVYPFAPSGNIYVSDSENGLFIF